jgi:hypothetical protein
MSLHIFYPVRMSFFSCADWILCCGMLLPVGHWVSRSWITARLQKQLQNFTEAMKHYEVSEKQGFHTLYAGTERFVTSTNGRKRATLSEESRPIKTHVLHSATEELEFRTSRAIQWEPLKLFPVTVRTYGFPHGYVYHPKSGMIAKHSETLLQDIWRLQRGACHAVAAMSFTLVGISWIFYEMNPSPDTQPFLYGLVRNRHT